MRETLQYGPYPDSYHDAVHLPRHNLRSDVQEFYTKGFQIPEEDLLNPEYQKYICGEESDAPFFPSLSQQIEIYHCGKGERLALTAVMTSQVVDSALKNRLSRPPFGLIYNPFEKDYENGEEMIKEAVPLPAFDAYDPFAALRTAFDMTLIDAWYTTMADHKKISQTEPNDPRSRNFLRLKQWEQFHHRMVQAYGETNGDRPLFPNEVFTATNTGVGSGTVTMSGLLRVIPEVSERDIQNEIMDPNLYLQIAQNSYPLIMELASSGIDIGPAFLEIITRGELSNSVTDTKLDDPLATFDPECFEIVKGHNGYRMRMKPEVYEQVAKLLSYVPLSGQKYTTGCPITVKIDGEDSAIKKLWNWNMDCAKSIYTDFWDSHYSPEKARETRLSFSNDA